MTVTKDRQRGTWYFVFDATAPDGRRRQIKRRGFATRKQAVTAEAEARADMSAGRFVDATRLTVASFLRDRWLPAIEADTKLKATTKAGYRAMTAHLVRGVGGVKLSELAGDHLTTLYGELRAAGKSERTVRYVHVTASKALRDARRWRLVAHSVAGDADAPGQTAPRPQAWTPEEVSRFLAEARTDRWWPLWRLLAATAMRRGEAAGLRWGSVDLESGALVVERNLTVANHVLVEDTPKSGRSRTLALDPGTVETLRVWRRVQLEERLAAGELWSGGDRVFCWPDGRVIDPGDITRRFGIIRDRLGLPPLRLHSLRHAWATNALATGVELHDVSRHLGHASIRITADIYVAPSSERDQAAANAVASLYDRSVTNL
jgi:integrase